MGNSVTFACTSLVGANKVGNLKKDENGYYEMVVGALNVYNSAGQFYVYEQAKEMFLDSSQLMRRVARGALRAEYGHPKQQPGQSDQQFAYRVMSIFEENVCAHHMSITLDAERVKDARGNPIIAIISKVKPSGPLGNVLQQSLENPNENVCFSIRAFSNDSRRNGRIERVLKTVVTFDYVNEPGIAVAEKFMSPALEGFKLEGHGDKVFNRGTIENLFGEKSEIGIATESVRLSADELFQSMGWLNASAGNSNRPSWAGWQ